MEGLEVILVMEEMMVYREKGRGEGRGEERG
jgi:hypothetical protein